MLFPFISLTQVFVRRLPFTINKHRCIYQLICHKLICHKIREPASRNEYVKPYV